MEEILHFVFQLLFVGLRMSLPYPSDPCIDPTRPQTPPNSTSSSLFKPSMFGPLPSSLFMRVHQAATASTAPLDTTDPHIGKIIFQFKVST